MGLKLPTQSKTQQLNTNEGVNLEIVYRSLLKIIAHLDEKQYTENMLCQTIEMVLDDPAIPASDTNTTQG